MKLHRHLDKQTLDKLNALKDKQQRQGVVKSPTIIRTTIDAPQKYRTQKG